jgi:hypothetical protein
MDSAKPSPITGSEADMRYPKETTDRARTCGFAGQRRKPGHPSETMSPWKPFLTGSLIAACLFHPFPTVCVGSGGGGSGLGSGGRSLTPPMTFNSICNTNVNDQGPQASGQSCPCSSSCGGGPNCPWTPSPDIAKGPAASKHPILYSGGAVYENAVDLTIPAPGATWSLVRSYANGAIAGGGATTQGNNWFNNASDKQLYGTPSSLLYVLLDGASERQFAWNGTAYTMRAPLDGYSVLTNDSAHSQYIFTDQIQNIRWTFNNLSVTNGAGRIKEESTLQLFSQGKSGYQYSYSSSSGSVSQITTPTGQDYSILFTYDSNQYLTQVQVKDTSGNLLAQVNYTYYQDVTSPSSDLGHTGDLVQVQVSKHATADAPGTLSIVRYTQYRYQGTTSNLKAVYEHDAIQRLLTSTGLSSPTAILSQADSYGTPAIKTFASRSFTYYTSDANTSSINTPFAAGENLQSEYGGSNVNETGYVATETIGGCGGCGSAYSVTKNYFYMGLANTASDPNQVMWLCVEDTQDSAGNAIYRTVFGLEDLDRVLRRAFHPEPGHVSHILVRFLGECDIHRHNDPSLSSLRTSLPERAHRRNVKLRATAVPQPVQWNELGERHSYGQRFLRTDRNVQLQFQRSAHRRLGQVRGERYPVLRWRH